MKTLLQIFGILDLISIILFAPQAWLLVNNFAALPPSTFLTIVSVLRIIVFLSLFISATGNLLLKRFGIITYYFQFLFRFLTLILTFGFITYLNEFFASEAIIKILLGIAVFGEFLRLYYSYKSQKELF